MPKRSLEAIVKKRLKQYKREKIILFALMVLGVILILAGIGVYFCVSKLTIAQRVYAVPTSNFMMSQLKLLCNSARVLGVVFSLTSVISITLALDRLTFSKESYRMVLYIDGQKEK